MTPETQLIHDLAHLIEQGKAQLSRQVNSTMTQVYWHIRRRINEEVLQHEWAAYGKGVIPTIAKALTTKYGRSFVVRNLRRMIQFSEKFPDVEMVSTLSTQLTWSHFLELILIKNEAAIGSEASSEQIELLEMHKDGIMVAEYWTELSPKKQLEEKNQQALLEARERIARKKLP